VVLQRNSSRLYPYFDSVYSGGGFTLGAGYRRYVGDYAFTEVRGLYSFKNYKSSSSEWLSRIMPEVSSITMPQAAGWMQPRSLTMDWERFA